MDVPAPVRRILEALVEMDLSPYLVGGCVRDRLLGLEPRDYDIALKGTGDTLEGIRLFLAQPEGPGGPYGSLRAGLPEDPGMSCQITLLRSEGDYRDGRHPGSVCFQVSLEEDLFRRDFTINSLAFEWRTRQLIDLWGVREGLARPVYRIGTCREPARSLSEDALRTVRAFVLLQRILEARPAGFRGDLVRALGECAAGVESLRPEVAARELDKLWEGASVGRALAVMEQLGVAARLFPSAVRRPPPGAIRSAFRGLSGRLENMTAYAFLCGTPPSVLWEDRGVPGALQVRQDRLWEVLRAADPDPSALKRRLQKVPARDRGALRRLADRLAPAQGAILWQIHREKQAVGPGDLAVGGADLVQQGITGARIARVLGELLEYVYEDETRNRRDILLAYARKTGRDHGEYPDS